MMNKNILSTILLLCSFSVSTIAQFGILDNSFGTNGRTITSFGINAEANAVAVQADGKIVVVGNVVSSQYDFALARYNTNGLLDPTFGNNGKITMDFLGQLSNDGISCVAIQPDGKIVVAGYALSGTNKLFALARFNSNGSLDTTFDVDGKATTLLPFTILTLSAIALQPDGKIIVGGTTQTGGNAQQDMALVRYLPNGSLDNTFGILGKVGTDFLNNSDFLSGIAIQQDGKIVAVGGSYNGDQYFAVARYQPNGALDNSFGSAGILITDFPGVSGADAVAIQQDGKIVVAGYDKIGTSPVTVEVCALARYNIDGSLDNSFKLTGKVTTPTSINGYGAKSLVIQPNGKIVVAAWDHVLRYETNGILDNSFGTNGKVPTDFIRPRSVAMQPDGKIVVAGWNYAMSLFSFGIERYTSGVRVGIIDFSIANNSIIVEPNPISEQTTLSYTLQDDETISIQIFDIQGKLIKVVKNNEKQAKGDYNELLVFPNNLPSGNYIVCILSPKGKASVKVLKM